MTKKQDRIIRDTISQIELVHEFVSSNSNRGIPAFATDALLDSLDGMIAHLQDDTARLKDRAGDAVMFAAMLEERFLAPLEVIGKKLDRALRQN
ncbi:hypothetical protein G6321_00011885 [Bradyrhizobium barranii subsp. barranii]|uniref:Uncharacterized protein n=1 Tax=Bradyrhizobium barranii subsp. barranii TaxID=2823807 RepID=A0A7Z0Q5B3_9BRAD|nr:hypothetical protein [Bradyrhizobium barranii]UGX95791.1 hypothetical protein G6321_00011885 [Bradyrhizobium barranii subsp. barranii]